MNTTDIIIIVIVAAVIILAALYVFCAKKKGKKCIGCPDSSTCSKKNTVGGCSNCNGECCSNNKSA